MSWRTVMGVLYDGNSGMNFRTLSSSDSLPSCASSATAKAVNCFEMDATWKMDCGVIASAYCRSEMP